MKWQVRPKAPSAFFKQFPEFSSLIVQLLYNRDLKTQKQIDEFFNSDFQTDIHDPFLLKEMDKAVKRIKEAIEKQDKITVYGDFDADGICSSAIIYLTLKELGIKNINTYIPNREEENHGLNNKSIKYLAKNGTKLIITVDCASSDSEEIDLANSLGVDVIITDHHIVGKKVPNAVALVNPWQKGDKYPFKKLAGAGVAYKLACALLPLEDPFKKWLLDLTALATVADVMPIIGENRTLVKYGLGVLAQTKWLGLKELMKVSNITPEIIENPLNGKAPLTNLDVYTLGFVLGPRLNAASRVDHADGAFNLLISNNKKEAKGLAQKINQNNSLRQSVTEKLIKEIEIILKEKFSNGEYPKIILEGNPNWPVGLIGLMAGKIADKYGCPTIVYNQKGNLINASCRSIPQFNLIKAFDKCADLFIDYGGHKAAAGFMMKKSKLDQFKNIFYKLIEKELKDQDLTPVLKIDAELFLEDINWSNYDKIQMFAPFGKDNHSPKFLTKNLEIFNLRTVGNGNKHLKIELIIFGKEGKAKKFNAIAFGLGDKEPLLKKGNLINIVFEIIVNQWNGRRDLEMKIIDLKLTE